MGVYLERPWQRLGSMKWKLRLEMSAGYDMPIRNQEDLIFVFTEKSGCLTQWGARFLREDLEFGDSKRVLVGVRHIRAGQFRRFLISGGQNHPFCQQILR